MISQIKQKHTKIIFKQVNWSTNYESLLHLRLVSTAGTRQKPFQQLNEDIVVWCLHNVGSACAKFLSPT